MLNQFFAHYLLNQGVLTRCELRDILANERQVTVKLGVLAVNAGLMTAEQVVETHSLQFSQDKKFGQLAIELGYLTLSQVEALVATQQESHLSLMQAAADKGYMTLAEIEQALAAFREEYGLNQAEDEKDYSLPVLKQLVDFPPANGETDCLYEYTGLFLRSIVRFLNDTPFIDALPMKQEEEEKWYISQAIFGDLSLSAGILASEDVLKAVASRFYGEELTEINELVLDSVKEFLNVQNGVFCGVLSEQDLKSDLRPPTAEQGEPHFSGKERRIPLNTSFGSFELILSVGYQ